MHGFAPFPLFTCAPFGQKRHTPRYQRGRRRFAMWYDAGTETGLGNSRKKACGFKDFTAGFRSWSGAFQEFRPPL